MTSSGRITIKSLFFLLLYFKIFAASNQVLFYSQTSESAKENFYITSQKYSKQHRITSLIGSYELIDPKNNNRINQISIPSIFYDKRTFLFRKFFNISVSDQWDYYLHFERVVGMLDIKINGESIYKGSHNFLPLRIRIPLEVLKEIENVLELTIQPWNGQPDQLPSWEPLNLPRIDNGICGSVYIEQIPTTSLRNFIISYENRGDSTYLKIDYAVQHQNKIEGNLSIRTQLISNNSKVLFAKNIQENIDSLQGNQKLFIELKSDQIPPWSIENPNLYSIDLKLVKNNDEVIDSKRQPFSVRDIKYQANLVKINGKPVILRGINYIYQNPDGISLFDRDLVLKDLEFIKDKGFNAIRVGYFPITSSFYDLTDSLGLLCFQDLPFLRLSEWNNVDSLGCKKWMAYIENFLKMSSDHPSIVGIGLGHFYKPDREKVTNIIMTIKGLMRRYNIPIIYASSYDPHLFESYNFDLYFLEILERNLQGDFLPKVFERMPQDQYVLISGFLKALSYRVDSSTTTHDLRQVTELYQRIVQKPWQESLAGNFVLTYSDYFLEIPALQAGPENNFYLNTIGIYNLNRESKKEVENKLNKSLPSINEHIISLERKEFNVYIFIIFGIINFFVFLIFYRSFLEFRKNVFRSIRRPHGLFVELHERRLISYEQSFFLMIILSVNAGVMLGGIFFFLRNNLYFDYFLSLILLNPILKVYVNAVIWKPIALVPCLTFLTMISFFMLALPIRLISLFTEPKVRFRQTIAISAWAAAPFILLLPFGMFFYNILVVMNSYWILALILLYFHIWYFERWLNGTRVMTMLSYTRVFLYAFIILLMVTGSVLYYLQQKVQVIGHLDYLSHLFQFHVFIAK